MTQFEEQMIESVLLSSNSEDSTADEDNDTDEQQL